MIGYKRLFPGSPVKSREVYYNGHVYYVGVFRSRFNKTGKQEYVWESERCFDSVWHLSPRSNSFR